MNGREIAISAALVVATSLLVTTLTSWSDSLPQSSVTQPQVTVIDAVGDR